MTLPIGFATKLNLASRYYFGGADAAVLFRYESSFTEKEL